MLAFDAMMESPTDKVQTEEQDEIFMTDRIIEVPCLHDSEGCDGHDENRADGRHEMSDCHVTVDDFWAQSSLDERCPPAEQLSYRNLLAAQLSSLENSNLVWTEQILSLLDAQTRELRNVLRQEGQTMEKRMVQHVEAEVSRWTTTMKGDFKEQVSILLGLLKEFTFQESIESDLLELKAEFAKFRNCEHTDTEVSTNVSSSMSMNASNNTQEAETTCCYEALRRLKDLNAWQEEQCARDEMFAQAIAGLQQEVRNLSIAQAELCPEILQDVTLIDRDEEQSRGEAAPQERRGFPGYPFMECQLDRKSVV